MKPGGDRDPEVTPGAARQQAAVPPPTPQAQPETQSGPELQPAPIAAADAAVIAYQLDRTPRDLTGIPVRCAYGLPAVSEWAPILSDGTPNPTLLYLTCPALATTISGIEARGGVRAFRGRCAAEPPFKAVVEAVTVLYRRRRATLAAAGGNARLEAGIGGPATPEVATCLHAHAAALLAVRSGWLAAGEALCAEVEGLWAELYPGTDEPWCSDRRCGAALRGRAAVLDVGTISVRLLVADVVEGRVHDVVRRAEVTRLGEGLTAGGDLSPAAKERTAAMVARFVQEARALGAISIALAGTSATRDARDGGAFIAALGTAHGVEAAVLSGEEEAALAYTGASLDVPAAPVVLDIGGGSTELIRRLPGGTLDAVSLALGAGRATEAWPLSDPPRPEKVERIYQESRALLDGYRERFGLGRVVGVAGTVTTLACLDLGLEVYDRDAVHLHVLTRGAVGRLLGELAALTLGERAVLSCMQPGRAAVIVAGTAILSAAMDSLGTGALTVSERDLLDGLILRVSR